MGAYIYDYGTLRNCVIRNNGSETLSTNTEIKGGGVYVEGGTMDNCKVYGNVLKNDKGKQANASKTVGDHSVYLVR